LLIIFFPCCSKDFAFKKIERCVCLFVVCTVIDSFNKKLRNLVPIPSSISISVHKEITFERRFSSLFSSVTLKPRSFFIVPIFFTISVLFFNKLIISSVISSILSRRLSISDMALKNRFYESTQQGMICYNQ